MTEEKRELAHAERLARAAARKMRLNKTATRQLIRAQKGIVREETRIRAKAAKIAEREQARAARVEAQALARTAKAAQLAQEREQARAAKAAQLAQKREQARAARVEAQALARAAKAAEREQARAARVEAQALARAQRLATHAAQHAARQTTRAFGNDPNQVYEFTYRLVDIDQLITSNTDAGTINPDYDQRLQPRQRDRVASQRQIEQVAKRLAPAAYLTDFHLLDRGAPIVGDDLMVESGNGRVLALRRARGQFGDRWQAYQDELKARLKDYGLTESDLDGKSAPVLVRERLTDVNRADFAREANAPPVLQMSTLETAIIDSKRIGDGMLLRLTVREDQSIDQALRSKANAGFVAEFAGTLNENESAVLMRKDGTLAQAGIRRIKAALFTRVFPGEAGQRIADTFLEAVDSNTKNFENALSASLPVLARAEGLIASGQRNAPSLADDISRSLDMLARIREADDMTPQMYVEQAAMFERETTPFQDRLLLYFDEIGRSPKKIREFLNEYAAAVEAAPDPAQHDLFGESPTLRNNTLAKMTAHLSFNNRTPVR